MQTFGIHEEKMSNLTANVGNALFQDLWGVLSHYTSPIITKAILARVMSEEDIDPQTLESKDLERIFQNVVFISLRLYCEKDELPNAMVDLSQLMERED